MRTRYSLDESGLLVSRDGETLGRVVSITLDDKVPPTTERVGHRVSRSGVATDGPVASEQAQTSPHTPPRRPTATELEREACHRVWVYWLEVSGKNQRLDSKRERIIRNALATVRAADGSDLEAAEAKVKQALLGLSLSPWHRGENEMRRPYMEVRYALKGRGDESDDERIEKACSWAVVHAPGRVTTLDPDKALRYLEEIRVYVSRVVRDPRATTGRQQAIEALTKLRAGGYDVDRLDRAPWARFKA